MRPADYAERVYAGFLGKCIGVRLGAPVESLIWTQERIRAVYGDSIHGYLRPYRVFGADDDINGPAYYFHVLREHMEPTLAHFGEAWLDYAREGQGFFWWGGIGQSTSHTVYAMLKEGDSLPIEEDVLRGKMNISEGIGGQIFVDSIGLCLPGQPERAADIAQNLASVAYYGEGVHGGRFMAAAVAAAFVAESVEQILHTALSVIPDDSDYARVVRAVISFHKQNPGDFRACMEMLINEWGYDRYSGICPMVPNAGVCALSMCYGEGDFNRTVEIATLCGWDTDCNAGNVGAILGAYCGMAGIDDVYIEPFADVAILSGVSGYLNICDIPTLSRQMAACGYRMLGEEPPAELSVDNKTLHYDFALPKSTHGFRVSNDFLLQIRHSDGMAADGKGSLEVLFNRLQKGNACRLYFKSFYKRADFEDGRYGPVFSPTVYPGQRLSMKLYMEQWTGATKLTVTPYVRTAFDEVMHCGKCITPENNAWIDIAFDIPDVQGGIIEEVGLLVESSSVNTSDFASRDLGRFFIDSVRVDGNARYDIDFASARKEFGCLTPFSFNRGTWSLEGDTIHCACEESTAAFTGNYFAEAYTVSCHVRPIRGESACLLLRGLGTARHVMAGLLPGGKAGVWVGSMGGYKALAEVDFAWETGKTYALRAEAKGDCVTLWIDGAEIASAKGIPYPNGMVGMGMPVAGEAAFTSMRVEEQDA